MGLLDRLAERIVQKAQFGQLAPWVERTAGAQRYNMPNMAVAENQAELYQRLSWVAIAVDHVAQQFASVPIEVKRLEGEQTAPIPNHPFEKLLMRPNPAQSRYEYLMDIVMFLKLNGNSYTWLNKTNENAAPTEMWTIPAHRIRPVPDEKMYLRGYMYDPGDGAEVPLESWEVMHIKRPNPRNRFIGLSPIQALAVVASGDMEMQKWNTNFFGKDNAKLPGILTFEQMMGDPEWAKVQHDFVSQAGGNKRSLMMLRGVGDGAVNWIPISMSQKDMEFLNARQFNKQEIFDLMAPGLTSWLAVNTTEANARAGRDAFLELGVFPVTQLVQEKITNDILPSYGDALVCQFDDVRPKDQLLQLKKQEQYERTHTINETREEFYGHDPVDGGDVIIGQQVPSIGDVDTDNDGEIDEQLTNKAHERDQFHRFASRRVKEGSPEKVKAFKFKFLDLAEQKVLVDEYTGESDLVAGLIKAIDKMSEAVSA